MAKQRFKGALNTSTFPLVSRLQTRTVVNPQLDVNVRTPRNPSGTEDYTDYSVVQMLYCENVVPTGEGLQSVGYDTQIAGLANVEGFDQAIVLRDANENNYLLSPANGTNYLYTATSGAWNSVSPIAGAAGKPVTRAYVNGRTFFCYEGMGIYEYNPGTNTIDKLTLIGITDAEVRGIGGSSNYLIAFTNLEVHWSSLTNPVDFTPSLTTGAGFAIPQDVKARITCVMGIAGGFVVYTAKNAVAAVFTNNARAPFTFKEISNAGGVLSYEQVTSEQNSGPHYIWSTGGLQRITIQGAEPVSGEVNDFIAGKIYEIYNWDTHSLEEFTAAGLEFRTKLAYISSRWLILSYTANRFSDTLDYALIFDTTLKRWGKLKIDHVDCFFYPYPSNGVNLTYETIGPVTYTNLGSSTYNDLIARTSTDPASKVAVAFLQADGTVKILEMDYAKTDAHRGVIIFGKFQLVRAGMMTLQTVDYEGIYQSGVLGGPDFKAYVQNSIDGYNVEATKELVLLKGTKMNAKYAKRTSGLNFTLPVEGTFALTSYVLEVTIDGDR